MVQYSRYKPKYRYRVEAPVIFNVPEFVGYPCKTDYVKLTANGLLCIQPQYAWNGANWPAINTKSSIPGSLAHDSLYQLIQLGLLPFELRVKADEVLRRVCIESGMWVWRANNWYKAVRVGGSWCAKKRKIKTLEAP